MTTSSKWIHSVRIATDIVNNDGKNTRNPIGSGMYFRATDWITPRLKQGGNQ